MYEAQESRIFLPDRINRLTEIAYDLWWSSSLEARSLFRSISRHLWWTYEHNPLCVLREVPKGRLWELATDPEFLSRYDKLIARYDLQMNRTDRSFSSDYPELSKKTIAYFSAEFGIHSSLPIYSGGLGVLAGDHVKTAHDLGVPLVGVGFLYPYGYFEQHITSEGGQVAEYRHLNYAQCPLRRVSNPDGSPLVISLHLGVEKSLLHLQVWKVKCGCVTMYLMDSDMEANATEDRQITQRLYGGDKVYRLRQEIALGVGGVRALAALGIMPDVWHANEGHSSFMFFERLRQEVHSGKSISDSLEHIRRTSIFTTHTPVPAGHDAFSLDLIGEYFRETIKELDLSETDFLAFGKHREVWGDAFNMTAFAMNMSYRRNAVSAKHRDVTRAMWKEYDKPDHPIIGITNGVHVPTWISQELGELFDHAIDENWRDKLGDEALWQKIHDVPDALLWQFRNKLNRSLQRNILDDLRSSQIDESEAELITRGAFFNPDAFAIGFARRFATYKRATLLFHDPDRLSRILNKKEYQVQLIFSGKAHPADEGGQLLIKELWDFASDPLYRGKIIFLENYNMHSAKYLVHGADLWLNTPRVPMEASGTSGMKAAINGVPNLSVLDGWWCEGYNGKNGWAIQSSEELTPDEQDEHDAQELYRLLEEEIIPLYYKRDLDYVPVEWMKVVKESMSSIIPKFSSDRMMKQYVRELYVPSMKE